MNEIKLQTEDGFTLVGNWFGTEGPVVVVNCATGVRRRYYEKFAHYLADNGFQVLTYDYRGMGDSGPKGSLRGFKANVIDWTLRDTSAALRYALERGQVDKVHGIGHSLGAQMWALPAESTHYDKLISVTAQSGYWGIADPKERLKRFTNWYFTFPATTALFGYFPGRKLGVMQDLPYGASVQWTRWCRHKNYHLSEPLIRAALPRFHAMTNPHLVYSFTDDTFVSKAAVEWLLNSCFPNTQIDHRRHNPADLGLKGIGHFGFFQPVGERFWPEVVAFLRG